MKNILSASLTFLVSFLSSCSVLISADKAPSSPNRPPTPRIASILPLEKGTEWSYSFTTFDSAGAMIFNSEEVSVSISKLLGLRNDSLRILPTDYYFNYDDSLYEFVYSYQWNEADFGYLLTYRDRNVQSQGLYILGKIRANRIYRYPTSELWLRYPSTAGDSWTVHEYDTASATIIDSMQMKTISNSEPFYTFVGASDGALRFLDCYHYSATLSNGSVEHYYYHKDYGCIAFFSMVGCKREAVYHLKRISTYSD
jgi:hypothetical protein